MEAKIFNEKPNEFRIDYPAVGTHELVIFSSLFQAINNVKRMNPNAQKISLKHTYSFKQEYDDYEENYEIQLINIVALFLQDVPQLIQTFSFSFITESSDEKTEYQFLVDEVSKRALFQRKFLDDDYQLVNEDDFTIAHLKFAFGKSGYRVVV